jgi:DNA-binding MarR family transcriptional regulator
MTPVSTVDVPGVGDSGASGALGPADADAGTVAATRLADTLGRLLRMIRRSHVGTLGPASAAALATVVRSGPLRLGELAYVEGVTPAALSRVVSGLERDGLVVRAADPMDRRSVFVEATPAGRTAIQELLAGRAVVLARLISQLSPAEQEALTAGVGVLELLAEAGSTPPPQS